MSMSYQTLFYEWVISCLGSQKMDVEVQEKQDSLRSFCALLNLTIDMCW
jgi:hypothetical protein